MSAIVIALFALAAAGQLVGVALLPRTAGFTNPLPTAGCCLFFLLGVYGLAELARRGVQLGILIPIMTGIIPLTSIVIGMVFYGESASALKLGLLISACVLVGYASSIA
jgi:multidrug transporter EmrE-like cation transporter